MFVSNVNPPNQKSTGTVAGDGWWPNVDADRMLKECRFDAAVTPERLRQAVVLAVGDTGAAYALVNGAGEVFGAWVIESVEETGTLFIREGLPRRIEFTLQLARVDDRQADPSGGTGGDGAPDEEWDDWDWWME